MKQEFMKIVAPDWIIDSIRLKELQPCEKYNPDLNIIPSPEKGNKLVLEHFHMLKILNSHF